MQPTNQPGGLPSVRRHPIFRQLAHQFPFLISTDSSFKTNIFFGLSKQTNRNCDILSDCAEQLNIFTYKMNQCWIRTTIYF